MTTAATAPRVLPTDAASPGLDEVLARIRRGESDGRHELSLLHAADPDNLEVLGHLAAAHAVAGDPERAIAFARKYLERNPDDIEMAVSIGDRLINLGRLQDAETHYQAIAERWPDDPRAHAGVRYSRHLGRADLGTKKHHLAHPPTGRTLSPLAQENKRLNQSEMAKGRLRLRSMPYEMFLASTTKCNFACKTCAKGYDAYFAEDLHADIFEQVKRDLMPYVDEICITGFGEPTMAGNFDGILGVAVDSGSVVSFTTNASLLSIERIEQLARTHVAIFISIDGGTKETFEEVRVNGSFDKLLERLALIQRLRRVHLSQRFSQWWFRLVALRMNLHELPELIRLAKRFDIDGIEVADYGLQWTPFDEQSPRNDPDHANRCLAEARRLADELGIALTAPPPYVTDTITPRTDLSRFRRVLSRRLLPERNRFPQKCQDPWKNTFVKPDGTVVPCCNSNQRMGSLKQRPFPAIWNGWRYRLLRWRINSTVPPRACRGCMTPWGINGANPGNVIAREGLLIAGFYWLEEKLVRLCKAAQAPWSRLGHRASGPAPNFHMGRPIRPRAESK